MKYVDIFPQRLIFICDQPPYTMETISNFFVAKLSRLLYLILGYREVAGVHFSSMPGVRHQSMLVPVALALK
jgi:hypothetical protein